jgi:hypothetical protein
MGDPVPIYQLYQQPAEPQLTSSDHEAVAVCRSSGMAVVDQADHGGQIWTDATTTMA